MALTLVTKKITFGDGSSGDAYFATDGTNFWPVTVWTDSNGAIIADSSGIPISASNLPLPSGAATAANQPTVAAPGSTTAGQTGTLIEGAVTTGPPAYTTAQTSPISLTLAGAVRTDASTTIQPISAASLPLPAGAAQDGTDGAGITPPTGAVGIRGWLSGIYNKLSTSIGVTGTFWQATQPVSATSLPLPSGAATAAKQAALGTAGAASADVYSVQGVPSGNPIPIAGTVTANVGTGTMPISAASLPLPAGAATAAGVAAINTTLGTPMQATGGFVTANAGTNLNTSALALEAGGNLAAIKTNTTITVAGTPATSGLPVQGMTGGSPVPMSAVSGALADGALVGLGSTTDAAWSGSGPMTTNAGIKALVAVAETPVPGAVTTAAPTYLTGTTQALSLNTAGGLRVDGSGATQPVSAASLPLPAGAATSANQPTNAAQGSTTSGQTGRLMQGAVTTAAPNYTTAQTSPLSLTAPGYLRVSNGSFAIAATSMVVTVGPHIAGTVIGTSSAAQGTGKQPLQFLKASDVCEINSIVVASKVAAITSTLKVFLFNLFPGSTTNGFTDASAPSIAAGDLPLLCGGPIMLSAPDSSLGAMTMWTATGLEIPTTNTQVYALVLVAATTLMTVSTSDFNMTIFGRY
jgi:hypothetical protein